MDDINEDLRETIPFDLLAARLGASREEVVQATEIALPALLQGMNANAHRSQEEATSLLGALIMDHDGSVLDSDDLVGRVDPDEGKKIVGHVFGDRTDGVVNRLGAETGGSALMDNLLPMLAPVVMAWLSKKLGGAVSSRGEASAPSRGLGDILGGLLGGGDSGGGAAGGGLGDILGGMLGGGPGAGGGSGGGLLDILGGLAGQAGQSSGAKQQMPDLSDLFGPR